MTNIPYNPINLKRGARLEMLWELTKKPKTTVQVYFSRNKMNILEIDDVNKYLKKYWKKLLT